MVINETHKITSGDFININEKLVEVKRLSINARHILESIVDAQINGQTSVKEVSERQQIDEQEIFKTLLELVYSGYIKYDAKQDIIHLI